MKTFKKYDNPVPATLTQFKDIFTFNYKIGSLKILSDIKVSEDTQQMIADKIQFMYDKLGLKYAPITIMITKYTDEFIEYFEDHDVPVSVVAGGLTVIATNEKYIVLNRDYLKLYRDDVINKTLPHEFAHFITQSGHGAEWQYAIKKLGLIPKDILNHSYMYISDKNTTEI